MRVAGISIGRDAELRLAQAMNLNLGKTILSAIASQELARKVFLNFTAVCNYGGSEVIRNLMGRRH